jgi:hypothetical protein
LLPGHLVDQLQTDLAVQPRRWHRFLEQIVPHIANTVLSGELLEPHGILSLWRRSSALPGSKDRSRIGMDAAFPNHPIALRPLPIFLGLRLLLG